MEKREEGREKGEGLLGGVLVLVDGGREGERGK